MQAFPKSGQKQTALTPWWSGRNGWNAAIRLSSVSVLVLHWMLLKVVIVLCRAFEAADLPFWVDGGWGVDALIGKQTRPHSDLDLAIHLGDLPRFEKLLGSLGYHPNKDDGARAWNPVFTHRSKGSVDLHGFVLNADGVGILGEPSENSAYPAGSLSGVGELDGLQVRCITAPFVLMFRNGFEPRQIDYQDVARLCDCLGLERPSRFQ